MTRYPSLDEYSEIVQSKSAIVDPELKDASVERNPYGLPRPFSGGFAVTYKMTLRTGRVVALRCFQKTSDGREERYTRIAAALGGLKAGPFVDFKYLPRGVQWRGEYFPVVLMDWVRGDTLGDYVERHCRDAASLKSLRVQFDRLGQELRRHGIGHGDIQNGNVLLTGQGLKLVDYDGIYVPGMQPGTGSELGVRDFQHPARSARHFGPDMDRFSLLVVDVSLHAIETRSELYRRYGGGEGLLFRANDYANPLGSRLFTELRSIPAIAREAGLLADVCRSSVEQVPTLEEFRRLTTARIVAAGEAPNWGTVERQRYVPSLAVLSGTDYPGVCRLVGNRVEVIGRIYEPPKYGRSKYDEDFVFLNFARWQDGNVVKINLWSDVLGRFTEPPDRSWDGKWYSVCGLVTPVFTDKFGRRSVGVEPDGPSQIRQITEDEARYRLATGSRPADADRLISPTNTIPVTATTVAASSPSNVGARPQPTASSNADILDRIRKMSSASPSRAATPKLQSSPSRMFDITIYVLAAMLLALSMCCCFGGCIR